jgi:hypothetical protein
MMSAFGVDHGDIEKAFNPLKAFKGARSAGKHAGASANPIGDQLAAKHGIAATAGGGKRVAAMPGKRKGSYSAKSFNPFGGGGARRA